MPDTERPSETHEAELSGVSGGVRLIVRQAKAVFGLSLIAISIPIGLITPFLPIGAPLAIVGVMIVARSTRWGQSLMESLLRRFPTLERFAPNWLMRSVFRRDKRPEYVKPR